MLAIHALAEASPPETVDVVVVVAGVDVATVFVLATVVVFVLFVVVLAVVFAVVVFAAFAFLATYGRVLTSDFVAFLISPEFVITSF